MVNKTVIINKFSEINIKTFNDFNLLYKTCLFRKPDNFICQFNWNNIKINNQYFNVQLWGKTIGTKQYINNCTHISTHTGKTFYYAISFVFYYSETNNIFDIDINVWNEFYNNYIINNYQPESNNVDENTYKLDNDSKNCENDSIINDDTIDNDSILDNEELLDNEDSYEFTELTYEPYYISSDDD